MSFLPENVNYELLDCGDFRKLERFGKKLVERPAPQASWAKTPGISEWSEAGFVFDTKWQTAGLDGENTDKWMLTLGTHGMADKINMRLCLSEHGQVGAFPEQIDNWRWLYKKISDRLLRQKEIRVLNGFAYTGGATLFSAKAGATEVTHVDASKSAINAAKHNAGISAISSGIRYIQEDMLTFIKRELKRGNSYDAIIMDPPAFGRAMKGKTWKLKRDLEELLMLCVKLLGGDPLFLLLTCHDQSISRDWLAGALRGCGVRNRIEMSDMEILSARGNSLPCGICVRMVFNA